MKFEKKYALNVEVTSLCNQSCYFCPQNKYKLRGQVMTTEFFKQIVDSLVEMQIPIFRIIFSGMGEPLTDKELFEKAEYSLKLNNPELIFYTNGQLFTEEKMKLANKLMKTVNMSIHMNTPEEYESYSGNKFEKIKKTVHLAKKILGGKLTILNYPDGKLGKYLELPIGATHPIHNWTDSEIKEKTGSEMNGCQYCHSPEHFAIKIKVDGSIATGGCDWDLENDLINKKFPVCERCVNYNYFLKMIKTDRFNDYVNLAKELQKRINQRVII